MRAVDDGLPCSEAFSIRGPASRRTARQASALLAVAACPSPAIATTGPPLPGQQQGDSPSTTPRLQQGHRRRPGPPPAAGRGGQQQAVSTALGPHQQGSRWPAAGSPVMAWPTTSSRPPPASPAQTERPQPRAGSTRPTPRANSRANHPCLRGDAQLLGPAPSRRPAT
jgi:hypothetical protein